MRFSAWSRRSTTRSSALSREDVDVDPTGAASTPACYLFLGPAAFGVLRRGSGGLGSGVGAERGRIERLGVLHQHLGLLAKHAWVDARLLLGGDVGERGVPSVES